MTKLNKAVVVITGATGGFGRELTRQLLEAGSHLILSDFSQKALDEWVAEISTLVTTGKIVACIASDLSSREGCDFLWQQVTKLNLPIDIWINNAGIGLFGRMDEVPPDKWEKLMEVNLLAPMRLSSLYVAAAIPRKKGHVVNISSLAGWIAPGGMAHYSSSKFGLRGFSEGLYNEVKSHNLKVTVVYPFFSRTPILKSERFGTLANNGTGFPEHLATDPKIVMAKTIQAIKKEKLHLFPDSMANSIYLLKQYFPQLYNFLSDRFIKY